MVRSAPRPVGDAGVLTTGKTQSLASGSEQGYNVFDREVWKKPVTSKEAGRILTGFGISGMANKIMSTIADSVEVG